MTKTKHIINTLAAAFALAMLSLSCGGGDKNSLVAVSGVSLSPMTMVLKVGESAPLTATVQPSNASNRGIVWETDNGNATLSSTSGQAILLTAVSAGAVTVKATTSDGGYTATCTVTVSPAPPKDWAGVSAGFDHALAIKTDGSLWTWGFNDYGQLGLGVNGTDQLFPVHVSANWKTVSAGASHSLAIKTDGSLWAWGRNGSGQLGLGDNYNTYKPSRVDADNNWAVVFAGIFHSLAVKTDGSLWAWGDNDYGQLGLGDDNDRNTPIRVGATSDWKTVSAGGDHTLALKNDGSLWAWGRAPYGGLGLGDTNERNAPVRVGTDTNWMAVSASWEHSMAIKTDGSLWGWGMNDYGQLGRGGSDHNPHLTPVRVGADTGWEAVSASGGCSLAIKNDGSLWAWGRNDKGQLGIGGSNDKARPTPVRVGADNNWAEVKAGDGYTHALKTDGSLWAWGGNEEGQLGLGDSGLWTFRNAPTRVGADNNWAAVSAGFMHTLALKADGSLWAWGGNGGAQLGLGNYGPGADRNAPTRVGAANDWKAVSAGGDHSLAIKTDGSLWAWGFGNYGQLGVGDNGYGAFRDIPTRVGAASDWKAVSAGDTHTVALKTDGSLWAWGWNEYGQLGIASNIDKSSPVRVGPANNWAAALACHLHSLALKTDNSLWAWGSNFDGQLGVSDTNDRNYPVLVGAPSGQTAAPGADTNQQTHSFSRSVQ